MERIGMSKPKKRASRRDTFARGMVLHKHRHTAHLRYLKVFLLQKLKTGSKTHTDHHKKKKINTNLNMLNSGNRETQIPRDCNYTQGKKNHLR